MRNRLCCAALPLILSGAAILYPSNSFTEEEKLGISWHNGSELDIEGRPWPVEELKSHYDRLPAKAERIVRNHVWHLSRTSAGMACRFNTDATEISIKYTLGNKALALPHMPATGVSGVDLYALDLDGAWKWVSCSKPNGVKMVHKITGIDPGMRSYMAYFPLRNSLLDISFGVPKGKAFLPVAPRKDKPIVFYGTSITHGACASRPGMSHVAILGRRFNRPVINLGFSGNGTMDPEVGALLAELDAAVYIIDCLPNMNGEQVAERAEPLVKQLRQARPRTPIILVEDRSFTNSWLFKSLRDHHEKSRSALVQAYDKLVISGVENLFYLAGDHLLGHDTEGATDGSHPSDLGFLRQANAFEPVIRQALETQ